MVGGDRPVENDPNRSENELAKDQQLFSRRSFLMKKCLVVSMLLLVLGVGAGWAQESEEAAQGDSLSLDHMLCRHQGPTATGDSGLFTLRSGTTLCRGQWAFGAYYNLSSRRVTGIPGRDPLWNDWNLNQDQLSLGLGYGLTDKIEISFSLPYYWYEASGFGGVDANGNALVQGGRLNGREFFGDIDVDGVGDFRVGAKFQLAEKQGYALALNAFVDLPTGDDDESVVTGDTGFGLGLNWSLGESWIANVGYSDPGDSDFGEVSPQIDLGIGYTRSINERLEWITELVGAVKTDGDEEHDEADITTGARYYFGKDSNWAFNLGLRVDLSEGTDTWSNYTPLGGLLGLTWSPRRSWDLSVSSAGECAGRVITDPEGASCSGAGKSYGCGKQVRLEAVPDDASCCEFANWSGDCSGSSGEIDLTLDGHKSCIANFRKKGPYTLSVKTETVGTCGKAGKVVSRPAGIDCGGQCSATFDCGQSVSLSAKAVDGVTKFTGWSRDCAGGQLDMNGDKSCTANFECLPPPPPPAPKQSFLSCEDLVGKKKSRRWPCDGSREIVYFQGGDAVLGDEQQAKLCDLVGQLQYCGKLSACVAGRSAASEDDHLASYRGQAVKDYLESQGVDTSRLGMSPMCKAPTEVGSWVDVYLEK